MIKVTEIMGYMGE